MPFCWLSEALRSSSLHQSRWIYKQVLAIHWIPFYLVFPARRSEGWPIVLRVDIKRSWSNLTFKGRGTVPTRTGL